MVWSEANSSGAQDDPNAVSGGPSKNPSSGASKDSCKADARACLHSEDVVLRRRAILDMADQEVDPKQLVDAVMTDTQQYGCGRVITTLGRRALPRLYHYLADTNEETSYSALSLVAIAGQSDANAKVALDKILKEHSENKVLQFLAQLGTEVSPEVLDAQTKTLVPKQDWPVDGVEWSLLVHERTRGLALARARMRLTETIGNLRHGSTDLGKVEVELQKGMLSLAFAARHRGLGQQEVDCLRELESEISKPSRNYDVLMPGVVMTRWMAGGRKDPQLLDKALSLFGRDVTGCESRTLGGLVVVFGDVMLCPDDVPVLLSRATDERAKEQIRIGALRLLGWLGSTDDRVQKAYRNLLTSEQQPIRLAIAEGIGLLIEKRNKGTLLKAAKARLSAEKSQPVLTALTSSIQRLAACP